MTTALTSTAPRVLAANTWDDAQQIATALSKSTFVPKEFQGQHANCLIALEMAQRTGFGVLQVMQNMYVVHGKPSFSGQFMIACINASGLYATRLRYDVRGDGSARQCVAWTQEHEGERIEGPAVTMAMAKQEKWGAKWQTMPEVMLRYRAAAFFARVHCPDVIMGMYQPDEIVPDEILADGSQAYEAKESALDRYLTDVAPIHEALQSESCTLEQAQSYLVRIGELLQHHGLAVDEKATALYEAIKREYERHE